MICTYHVHIHFVHIFHSNLVACLNPSGDVSALILGLTFRDEMYVTYRVLAFEHLCFGTTTFFCQKRTLLTNIVLCYKYMSPTPYKS